MLYYITLSGRRGWRPATSRRARSSWATATSSAETGPISRSWWWPASSAPDNYIVLYYGILYYYYTMLYYKCVVVYCNMLYSMILYHRTLFTVLMITCSISSAFGLCLNLVQLLKDRGISKKGFCRYGVCRYRSHRRSLKHAFRSRCQTTTSKAQSPY